MIRLPEQLGVAAGGRAYVVAELSANHDQDFDRAIELVDAAHAAGADAIKLQTYTPDTITLQSDAEDFVIRSGTVWDGRTLYDLYGEAYTPWEWHAPLQERAESLGMGFFSSPFDPTAVDFLADLEVLAIKIASFEIVDVGLIERSARTGLPLIISTGMATFPEIEEAVSVARGAGASRIVLLKCTSSYPAPVEEANLRTMAHLATSFGVPVGLSDHTLGTTVAIAAVAMGAVLIEKHFTMRRSDGGPDSGFSLEPAEFRAMVEGIRDAEAAIGQVSFEPTAHEVETRKLRRSLFIAEDLKAGDALTTSSVRSVRPAAGLHTRHLPEVLGRRVRRDTPLGTPLSWDLLEPAGSGDGPATVGPPED
jgi:pseudaminic acid synthase